MNRIAVSTIFFILFTLATGVVGCKSQTPDTDATPAAGQPADGHGEHSQQGGTDMEKMKAELAKLSPEDAASAEKQHICPVSGEMLGTMGAPKRVDVNGQLVWICCDACRDKLLADPETYLAKLKKE